MTKTPLWKKLLVGFASVITAGILLAIGLILFLRLSGEAAWREVEKELAARGELKNWEDIRPSPVADEENFFGDPMWKELADLVPSDEGQTPRVPKGERQLDQMLPDLGPEEYADLAIRFPELLEKHQESRFVILRDAWKKIGSSPTPEQRRRVAELTSEILRPTQPLFEKLTSLSQRRFAYFPFQTGDSLHFSLEPISYGIRIGQLLMMQARGQMALGEIDDALQSILLIKFLARAYGNYPIFLTQLVSFSLVSMTMVVVDEGLKCHVWNKAQLNEIMTSVTDIDLRPQFLKGLEGERAYFNFQCQMARENPDVFWNTIRSINMGKGNPSHSSEKAP